MTAGAAIGLAVPLAAGVYLGAEGIGWAPPVQLLGRDGFASKGSLPHPSALSIKELSGTCFATPGSPSPLHQESPNIRQTSSKSGYVSFLAHSGRAILLRFSTARDTHALHVATAQVFVRVFAAPNTAT